MSTKKSVVFLLAVILISIVFMSSLFMGDLNPTESNPSSLENGGTLAPESFVKDDIINIEIVVALENTEFLALQKLSDTYELTTSGINFILKNIPKGEVYNTYKKASQLGDAPDIMLLDNIWVNEFAALSYLTRVDEILMSNMQSLQINSMVSQVKWNGYTWAVPKDIDPYIMAWSESRLAELDLTEAPRTSNEFLAIHKYYESEKVNNEDKYGYYLDFTNPFAFISLVGSIGVPWMDPDDDDRSIISVKETNLKLEDFFNSSARDSEEALILDYPKVQADVWQPWKALNEGEIAMMISSFSDFKKYASDEVLLSPIPDDDNPETMGGWLNGNSFAVSSKSSQPKEAFEWIEYFSTPEVQLELMEAGGGLPVMLSAYESPALKKLPYFRELVKSIDQGGIFSAKPQTPNRISWIESELRKLWVGEYTVQEFTEQIDKLWNE